jgi:spore cortex formation protein SpoVR/YcgB (stage V sporulation)
MSGLMVTISVEEYKRLHTSEQKLDYLESAGVDNWSGYDYMYELMEDSDDENIEDISLEKFIKEYITPEMLSSDYE